MSVAAGADQGYLHGSMCAQDAFAVTPADGSDFANPARALYVGTAGDLNVDTVDGTTVLFKNVAVGFFPVACKRVRSTNTTASNIVGLL
jgi:hypothetical protein